LNEIIQIRLAAVEPQDHRGDISAVPPVHALEQRAALVSADETQRNLWRAGEFYQSAFLSVP
jgi:hypothetical protein